MRPERNPSERRPLSRHRRRRNDNVKKDLKETEYEGVVWVYLPHGRNKWWVLVNTVVNLRVP
jgi:hypothetical protein